MALRVGCASGGAPPGPQGLIDDAMEIENADIVVAVFWNRLGTPVLHAASGTAHELSRAWGAWVKEGSPEIMVYLCERKARLSTVDEAEQLRALLRYRDLMPPEIFWWRYTTLITFERAVRDHLTAYLIRTSSSRERPVAPAGAVGRAALEQKRGGRGELEGLDEVWLKNATLQAIGGLPPGARTVLTLMYFHGLSTSEAADVLGLSRALVEMTKVRALARLRLKLLESGGQPTRQSASSRAALRDAAPSSASDRSPSGVQLPP
ncbi:MAG: hypothetical protein QOG94_20 [Solirubrobacteraceae bacterium]|nr:hypothetical protein [Solirubrobacteraceae bacterium]